MLERRDHDDQLVLFVAVQITRGHVDQRENIIRMLSYIPRVFLFPEVVECNIAYGYFITQITDEIGLKNMIVIVINCGALPQGEVAILRVIQNHGLLAVAVKVAGGDAEIFIGAVFIHMFRPGICGVVSRTRSQPILDESPFPSVFVAVIHHEKVRGIDGTIVHLRDAEVKHMVIPAGPGGIVGNTAGHTEIFFTGVKGLHGLRRSESIFGHVPTGTSRFEQTAIQNGFRIKIVQIASAFPFKSDPGRGIFILLDGQKAELLHRNHIDGVIGAGLAEGVDAVGGIKARRRIGLKAESVGHAGSGTVVRGQSRRRQRCRKQESGTDGF